MTRRPLVALALLAALLASCVAQIPNRGLVPPPPVHKNGLALWVIISTLCVPGQVQHGNPSPCALVSLEGGQEKGFVLLKDRAGVSQYLLMPTARITGIEDPKLLAPGATNYFARAWDERGLVSAKLGRPLPRDETSVAVNSIYGRSQDQLHLHIDCLDAGVHEQLKALGRQIGTEWSRTRIRLGKHAYWARRLDGEELRADPFRLLADTMPGARSEMGAWTLVLVGERGADGRPGFYLFAGRADPAHGEDASGEVLQDHDCGAPPAAKR
jgi:CDP-diacylglycerol pyrophosphatase